MHLESQLYKSNIVNFLASLVPSGALVVLNVFPLLYPFPEIGAGTYTTSSLSTKSATTSDPPNICKVKPQQLQTSTLPSASHFSQLSCMPSLIAQQQQSPQVYVSQSAAGNTFVLKTKAFLRACFLLAFSSFKYLWCSLQLEMSHFDRDSSSCSLH